MNGVSADLLLATGSAAAVLALGLVFYGLTVLVLRVAIWCFGAWPWLAPRAVFWIGRAMTREEIAKANGLPHEDRQTAAGGGETGLKGRA